MIKLVIWDLDDTLWRGTLADGDDVVVFESRAALVRELNARGVVSSICSKNNFETAKRKLVELGLWDEFVFAHIAFTPKAAAIEKIIADMQLRACDVLFVDDNALNLEEVRYALPEIQLLDITQDDADAQLEAVLGGTPMRKSRVEEYRLLERKIRDRDVAPGSNEDFLRSCAIKACAPFLMDNLDFTGRIAELINRSNQLNYTKSRVDSAELEARIIDVVGYDSWSIFAWDRYGHYGLVGFVMIDRRSQQFVHFVFSCRAMHMGLEAYALAKAREKWPTIDASQWHDRFSQARPDWIEDCSFHDPDIRSRLIAEQVSGLAPAPALRIMFDCQSGGIAHFSRNRGRIEFDNNPRLFALRSVWDDGHLGQDYPPLVVYGAGIDYTDPRWAGLAPMLDHGVYRECVRKLCAFFDAKGIRALIVLPPENAPEQMYRPQMNQTRDRTARFNREWWMAAAEWKCIDIVDLSQADSADMADVSHYRPRLLVELAETIDDWLEAAEAPALGEAA
ncbi:HAD-IIIC family phosphatase [Sphingomonas psychrotolerans]|uniref:HAD-IIIC family phosphatase n=1 Tax=Sphingomonas psychrotolerans TaxID=1327635 RepID=A0ABU3N1T0_9SPHN|nr:HAD-IIIC family phosphatase [Sphingomonas psychrotolerans]MDT8758500.1 HAD-IIIC family phosphatase [Sphingomonas psychrotolerans]